MLLLRSQSLEHIQHFTSILDVNCLLVEREVGRCSLQCWENKKGSGRYRLVILRSMSSIITIVEL